MTFDNVENAINNVNANVNEAAAVAVKVSYGDEIRRATFNGNTFASLLELSAKLFGLEQANVVLKYQDEDGDKITMSSDGELQDALRLLKDKALRFFVETKPVVAQEQRQEEDAPFYSPWGRRGSFGFRGGRHGFPHGGPHGHHGPHDFGGPHGFRGSFGGMRGGRPCRGGRGGFGPFGGFGGEFRPVDPNANPIPNPESAVPNQEGPCPTYGPARVFAHGSFYPADGPFPDHPHGHHGGFHHGSPYARHAFKEHKKEMKETLRMMKENAKTPEDYEAIKEFKEQIKGGMKDWKKECKKEKKEGKMWKGFDHKHFKHACFAAKHVADVTIPDNSELPVDTPVTKTWRLRNTGAIPWPADSQLIFISHRGDNLNGPERVPVGSVEPGQEVDVSVTFITPSEPGRYVGYYRMASAESKFGQRVWVAFIVPATAADPAPAPAPAPPANTTAATSSPAVRRAQETIDVTMD